MRLEQLVLNLSGHVNRLFDVMPLTDYRVEGHQEKDEQKLLELLRFDREEHWTGPGVPKKNPSQDTSSAVQYLYRPTMEKQRFYAQGFPISMGTFEIIDAFVCLGSRFYLEPCQVFVEVCRSHLGGERQYWVNVYTVGDPHVPVCVIRAINVPILLDTEEVLRTIERDREDEKAFQESIRKSHGIDERNAAAMQVITQFLGCRMEVRNADKNHILHGEISEVSLEGDTFTVTFAWAAEGELARNKTSWTKRDSRVYEAQLGYFTRLENNGYEFFHSSTLGEFIQLFPADVQPIAPADAALAQVA